MRSEKKREKVKFIASESVNITKDAVAMKKKKESYCGVQYSCLFIFENKNVTK